MGKQVFSAMDGNQGTSFIEAFGALVHVMYTVGVHQPARVAVAKCHRVDGLNIAVYFLMVLEAERAGSGLQPVRSW